MRKPKLDDIEIQEPPLEELKKKRSCLRNSCISGCGCLVFILVGLLIFIKIVASPTPKEIDYLPESVEQNVPIYDIENIEKVEIISSQRRSWIINFLLKIPKFIAGPITQVLDLDLQREDSEKNEILQEAYQSIENSLSGEHDYIIITWLDLDADPKFITDYYRTELRKKNFKVNTNGGFQFTRKEIEGILYIEDREEKNGTDKVVLTLRIPINL